MRLGNCLGCQTAVDHLAAIAAESQSVHRQTRFVDGFVQVKNYRPFQTDVDHPAVTVVKILSVHRTMPSVRDSASVVKSLRYQMAVGRRGVIAEMT